MKDSIHQNDYSHKNIWQIAYPIILGSLAQELITVIDTALVGRLGEVQMGAAAIGGIFYLSLIMLGWGFGSGVQILISRRLGEKNIPEINKILFHSFIILIGIAILIFLTVRCFAPDVFMKIIQSEHVASESIRFINIRIFGIFAAFININFRAFYIGTGNTKIISVTTIVIAVVNTILAYLFIFGKGAIPAMGIKGAALASVLAELSGLLVFILYTSNNSAIRKFKLFSRVPWNFELVKNIGIIAFPIMIQNFLSFTAWFIFFLFVEKMGETPLAISNIIRSIYIVILVPIFGFSAATNTLVSYSIGSKESTNISPIIKRSLTLTFVGISVLVFICLLFPEPIIRIYTNIDSIVIATIPAFYVVLIAVYTISLGNILLQAVSGTGKTHISLVIEIIAVALYLAGVFVLANQPTISIEKVWTLEIFYGLVIAILSAIYLKRGKWKESII
jgi:putative MATE family efflux protein